MQIHLYRFQRLVKKKAPLCFHTTYEDRNSVEKLEPDYKSSIIHSYVSCFFSQFFSVKPSAHRSL